MLKGKSPRLKEENPGRSLTFWEKIGGEVTRGMHWERVLTRSLRECLKRLHLEIGNESSSKKNKKKRFMESQGKDAGEPRRSCCNTKGVSNPQGNCHNLTKKKREEGRV